LINVEIREGVLRLPYFLAAFLLISVFPAFAMIRQVTFESERWKDSSHSPFSSIGLGEDEEEEE
jgi:hypothetical protein